jgi:threonine dehydratase
VIGVEPAAGDDVQRSFRSGSIQRVSNPDTIADGARTSAPGAVTFPLIMKHLADVVTVDDDELIRTMWTLWERMKIVVEPTGALGAAALLEGKLDAKGLRVGVVISGGNADIGQLCRLL